MPYKNKIDTRSPCDCFHAVCHNVIWIVKWNCICSRNCKCFLLRLSMYVGLPLIIYSDGASVLSMWKEVHYCPTLLYCLLARLLTYWRCGFLFLLSDRPQPDCRRYSFGCHLSTCRLWHPYCLSSLRSDMPAGVCHFMRQASRPAEAQ